MRNLPPILLLLMIVLGCGTEKAIQNNSNTSTPTTTTATPAPTSAKATSDDLGKAAEILSANTEHYAQLLSQGKMILGTKQYSSGMDGLKALDDPNSSAFRFGQFRVSTMNDLTFQDAFSRADGCFTADNEPDSIGEWQIDILQATSDLNTWTSTAVDWQINKVSTAKLKSLEQIVIKDLAKARADVLSLKKGK